MDYDFDVGDYVLVARSVYDKDQHKDKTKPVWYGPARVEAKTNPRVFTIRDLITDNLYTTHATYLKRYSDRHLELTDEVMAAASYGSSGFVPQAVLSHFTDETGVIQLQVLWEAGDVTTETAVRFKRDAPRIFNRYVKSVYNRSDAIHRL